MARLTDTERAARQAQKVEQERAKLAQLQSRISKRERARDTQRKIIIGGVVLAAMKQDAKLAAYMTNLVRRRVTRAQDKAALADFFAEAPEAAANASGAAAPSDQAA